MNPAHGLWRSGAPLYRSLAAAAVLLLSACGGGKSDSPPVEVVRSEFPASRSEAARFLTQATFGPTDADIDRVMTLGYAAWIDRQFALPATSHRVYVEDRQTAMRLVTPTAVAGQDQVMESFWKQAATGEDQLRQRVAFAMSQIFVVSALDNNVGTKPREMGAWLDMLGDKGLSTYRELLESVALHPFMAFYLTYLRNPKPDELTGRSSDQNFARESMQLFSLGLVKLNLDGTPVLVNGQPVETYTPADVVGLSWVFTGLSYACPAAPSDACYFNTSNAPDPDRYFKSMTGYPQHHSTDAKSFLGVTIPASTTSDPLGDVKIALDTLAAHPNVGPFIGRLLIQRLVTSNPSPRYVRDVATVFNNNGSGVRGDLKAVVKAILLHPEALPPAGTAASMAGGKVREPVLRLSAYLRAFPHTSDSGWWRLGRTDNAASLTGTTTLNQTPLRAPSVFNFFRGGYIPPGTQAAAAGLQVPEMEVVNEGSAAGWINYMRDNLAFGVGQSNGTLNGVVLNRRDIQRDWSAERALAATPSALVSSITGKLLPAGATAGLTEKLVAAVESIPIPALSEGGGNQAAVTTAQQNRVMTAVLLVLASPEFLTQP